MEQVSIKQIAEKFLNGEGTITELTNEFNLKKGALKAELEN